MMVNLAAHWLLGLPVSYTLVLHRRAGACGAVGGASRLGLIVTGVILIGAWTVKIQSILNANRQPPGDPRLPQESPSP